MKLKNKYIGLGTLSIPLLIFSVVFPLQILRGNSISLGEIILKFLNLPSWSIDNFQGRNYTFIYAYVLFYLSLFIGCVFPNHFMSIKLNKKILVVAFLCTTVLLIILYTVNTATIREPTIIESAYFLP